MNMQAKCGAADFNSRRISGLENGVNGKWTEQDHDASPIDDIPT
jgi:hypothetical protein